MNTNTASWLITVAILGLLVAAATSQLVERVKLEQVHHARISMSLIEHELISYYKIRADLPASLGVLEAARLPKLEDPWGNAFIYTRLSSSSFRIESRGPDGVPNSDDDITDNWDPRIKSLDSRSF